MASRPLIAASVCLLTFLGPAGAASTPDRLGGLLANSPFGSPRAGTPGSGTGEPLEFRAVLEENGNRFFSIYETTAHRSNWVDLNDPVNEFSVKDYDAAHDSVTVEYQGKPLKLALKRAAPVVAAAPAALPGNVAPPSNRSAQVVQTPVPAQQLQQIRDEINRRRALRQQQPVTTTTTTITVPPPPPVRP
ncbi:MAG TPA: hypothetical protein VKC51_10255 [Lacunisphaera sp.]|nr:hypothetical protein [Lacunisphaera sp.]